MHTHTRTHVPFRLARLRQSQEASLQKDARNHATLMSGVCVCWLQCACFALVTDRSRVPNPASADEGCRSTTCGMHGICTVQGLGICCRVFSTFVFLLPPAMMQCIRRKSSEFKVKKRRPTKPRPKLAEADLNRCCRETYLPRRIWKPRGKVCTE